ncbi:MAG: Uma2 family endonuclease [Bacteroidota bacterium]
MINHIDQLDFNKKYTYADYLTWQLDEMVELIHGSIFRRSPAPGRTHQLVSSSLLKNIFSQLKERQCQVFHAPFDVRLPLPEQQQTAEKIDTVVQPDICMICDLAKLDERGCQGAPDWIIEILSEGTAHKDLNDKFQLYEFAGVPNYWIVHPHEQTVLVYTLATNGKYQLLRQRPYAKGEQIQVYFLEDFVLDLGEVFSQ